jgi:signal transduction histidine kinase
MTSPNSKGADEGRVVYRRLDQDHGGADASGPGPERAGWRQLAPNLWPLLAGFIFLLLLVLLLGLLSERELDAVRSGVANRQMVIDGKNDLMTQSRAAAERVNNEARIRADRQAQGGIQPPFAINLNNARDQLQGQLKTIEGSPLVQNPSWGKLANDLRRFHQTTANLEEFDANGFVEFRNIREDFDRIQTELQAERQQIDADSEALRERAVRRVRLLWITALLLGVLIVAATLAEVQKRFRQVNRSVETARRERRFSTQILEGMVSAVAAVDHRGRIRSANSAFMDIFPDAMIGVSVHSKFLASESLKALEAAIAQPVKEATYFGRFRQPIASKSQAERTFDVYSSPLDIDGEEGRIITLMDVTDAVEADTAVRRTEALAAVGQASAQLAHEIKNPLGSIRLGVSILRDMTERADAVNTIDLVERGIEHLSKLVIDVTQFSRHRDLTIKPVEMVDLLDVSLMLVEDRIQDKDITVLRDFGEPVQGRWDEDQLTQVFVNLLANAIDASPPGASITVQSRVIAESRLVPQEKISGPLGTAKEFVRVVIEDNGSGMDPATRARIFEPFYTTKKRGTGLGLAVVKQIVEQHGGAIAVESEVGQGTRFIIELPLGPKGAGVIDIDPAEDTDQVEAVNSNA